MAYHIKAASGEGYLAWNSLITNSYVSLRGVTASSHNGLPANKGVANIYQEEVDPFDATVVWQILKDGGSYYLYQPANKLYVTRTNRDNVFTADKTALDKIRDNGDGTFSFHAGGDYPKSIISVMMITSSIFEQMYLRFEGTMGSHCNRKTGIQMTKRKYVCA